MKRDYIRVADSRDLRGALAEKEIENFPGIETPRSRADDP